MAKMRIKYLFQLLWCFIITGIISGIELAVWLYYKVFFISLMTLENDVFGIRYAVAFTLVAIPAISAIAEYQSKQKKISEVIYKLLKR